MPMLGAILVPHPPALLPEVGRGRERALSDTESAIRAVAAQAARRGICRTSARPRSGSRPDTTPSCGK